MERIAIVTDSNSSITQAEAKKLGVFVIPMPFIIDDETYYEDINLTQKEFYEKMAADTNISTSQPEPGKVCELWDEILKDYDKIIHIPMSSGLSNSCQTAFMLAQEYDGKVVVVDNQRISVTIRESVLDALKLVDEGKSAEEIRDYLTQTKGETAIYLMVDTLKYLKKGGRISPAAAALGTMLQIKPVLTVAGEKLEAYAKARSPKQGKVMMLNAAKNDALTRLGGNMDDIAVFVVHSQTEEAADTFKKEAAEALGISEDAISLYPVPLSIACHTGPGVMAIACVKKYK